MALTGSDPTHWKVAARAAFLAQVRLFENLPAATVYEIAARFRPKAFQQGAFIFLAGEPAESLDLLVAGRISIIRETETGQSVILRLIGPGEFFGWGGGWGERELRTLLDALLSGLATSRCRLRSVRTDAASFARLGLAPEAPGSGRHAGVPVLMTDLEPDTVVLAFAPRRP